MIKKAPLIIVILLAFFFRVYALDKLPPSLNWDEVSHGYNAYSLLKTGRDEWGEKWPLIFRAYGDYKLPLYIYLTLPFVSVLGLNPFSVRIVSVLSGVGLVWIGYFFGLKLFDKKKYAFLLAFLMALSPWDLFISRFAAEANLGVLIFSLGMYFILDYLKREKVSSLKWTALFWGLSLFAYNSARVLVPILGVISFFFVKKKPFRQFLWPVLIMLVFFIPIIFQLVNRSAKARYEWVTLIDQGAVSRIIFNRQNSHLPVVFAKLWHNRLTYFVYYAATNYLKNISPHYLFFRGGSHYQFSLPDHEILYLVMAPFLLLGLLISPFNSVGYKMIGLWFLSGFIPSAITQDAPHVLRSLFSFPAAVILTTGGVAWLSDRYLEKSRLHGRLLFLVMIFSVLISFSRWWRDYWQVYRPTYAWAWQYGYEDLVSFLKNNYSQYDKIFVTKKYGEPHEFILFYWSWNPRQYQENKIWNYHANWYWVDGFDKFTFRNDWEMKEIFCPAPEAKCLLVTSPKNYPPGWRHLKTVSFLDGRPAFEILEYP